MEEFMTLKEVAKYLRLSVHTLYKMAQQGRIPAMKAGAVWRFKKNEIDKWMRWKAEEEKMTEKCRKCGHTLYKIVPLDDKGNLAQDVETPLDLETEGGKSFFRCKICGAKNIVISTKSPSGLPAYQIVYYEE